MSPLAQSTSSIQLPDELTPHLVLAVALLYVASSDGGIHDAPKLQLLAVLGGDEAVFENAATYINHIPFEQFLRDAPSILTTQEKLCVLVNVCDVLLTARNSEPAALALFQRMLTAFGLSAEAFAPYYKTLVLKNDSTVMGAYDSKAATAESLTAHVALATSLLYTMAASGSIAAENMGHLQALIGGFEGLQSIALAYIRRVKFNQFLPQAAARLTEPQKIYILVQACDSVLLDGQVEDLERQMFNAMLTAFGYSERSFRPYFHTIEIKNAKPVSEFADTAASAALGKGAKKPGVFETRSVRVGDKTKALVGADSSALNTTALASSLSGRDAGPVLTRSMPDNVQEIRSDLGADANLAFIHPSAGSDANIQQIGQNQSALNRQTLDDNGLALNRQSISTDPSATNRQAVASAGQVANQQRLGPNELLGDNLQSVGVDRFDDQRALVPIEDRLKDLDLIIDNLQRKIDQFERKNKTVLREASQAKLTHPPQATDEIAQISTPHHPRAVATSHLQIEKAAERILDLQNETRDWNVIWISSTVAIVSLTSAMSLRIFLG
jgi:hypothetical protein